jgi:hypothetical protein
MKHLGHCYIHLVLFHWVFTVPDLAVIYKVTRQSQSARQMLLTYSAAAVMKL